MKGHDFYEIYEKVASVTPYGGAVVFRLRKRCNGIYPLSRGILHRGGLLGRNHGQGGSALHSGQRGQALHLERGALRRRIRRLFRSTAYRRAEDPRRGGSLHRLPHGGLCLRRDLHRGSGGGRQADLRHRCPQSGSDQGRGEAGPKRPFLRLQRWQGV